LDGAELRYLLLEMMTMFQRRAILRKYCEWVGKLHERNKYAFEDFKASGLRFTDKTGVDFSVVDPPQIKIEEGTPENMARRYDSVPSTLSKLKNELFVNILNPTNSNKIQTILDVLWEKLLTESKLSDGLVDFGKLSLLMDPVNGDEVVGRLFLDIEAGLDFETRDMASGLTDEQILRVQNRTRAGRNVSGLNKLVLELGEYVKTNPENEAIKRFGGYILVETPGVKRYFGLNGARSVIIINSEDGGKEVVDEGDRQEMSEMVNYILRSWFN